MIENVSPNQCRKVWKLTKVTLSKTTPSKNALSDIIRRTAITFFLFTLSTNILADTLHIAVASNFITPIKQLALQFEQETNNQLKLSFGSSGKLFAQIQHGAPFDIFLSADQIKPNKLIQEKLAKSDSLVVYAKGKLVLWSTNPIAPLTLKENLLAAKRIAIANPKLAPYGKAAAESLQNLGVWSNVKDKLVLGENIAQTYQFVYSQNADLGLVALSQIITAKVQGHIQDVPNALHSDITQTAVILSNTKKTMLAKAFMVFLMRSDSQATIRQFGYSEKP